MSGVLTSHVYCKRKCVVLSSPMNRTLNDLPDPSSYSIINTVLRYCLSIIWIACTRLYDILLVLGHPINIQII